MAADYRKFKTPYFEIQVSDSSGRRKVKLPHHLLRLVQKVEIIETFVGGEFNTINLEFVEGSREPASPDASLGTKGLYSVSVEGNSPDMDISGSITNRVGSIADLRFSGNGGITFLTAGERASGRISNKPEKNIVGETVTRSHKKEPSAPVFLFQERNKVKITWGYLEDPETIRSVIGYVRVLTTSYPDNDQVRTTITCVDTASFLDQIATREGVKFGRRVTRGGDSIVEFEDLETDKVIREIADKAGMASVVSSGLPASKLDKNKQKMWVAGESFNQFMTRLAEIHGAYYTVKPNKDGVDTIYFIQRKDFESRLVIRDVDLTTYKAPGSILKSVEIRADFGAPTGNSQKGVTEDGKQRARGNDKASSRLVKHDSSSGKDEEAIPSDPINHGNPVPGAKGISENVAKGGTTGTVDYHPDSNPSNLDEISLEKANENNRNIVVEFTTLGYTKFSPGIIELRNIGVRYSGKYRLQTVTHVIDSSGYTTRGTALSWAVATGGVKLPETTKVQSKDEKVRSKLTRPDNDIMREYDKSIGRKD